MKLLIALLLTTLVACGTVSQPTGGVPLTPEQQRYVQITQTLDSAHTVVLGYKIYMATKRDDWTEEKYEGRRLQVAYAELAIEKSRAYLAEGNFDAASSQAALLEGLEEALSLAE